ncbi:hypothetical protein [Streptomyces sp. NPDC006875]|uniref:hypothetical protein n=1 Tax=Streptomyces sp. NPDC006875 TaxID=3154781 RepID=UPI0034095290
MLVLVLVLVLVPVLGLGLGLVLGPGRPGSGPRHIRRDPPAHAGARLDGGAG